MSIAPRGTDLSDAQDRVQRGETTATALLAASLAAADAPANAHVYLRRFDAGARAAAAAVDLLVAAGQPLPPLGGLAVSVKDLFDVAGAPTTAGSAAMADAPAAAADCRAVARLRVAGAALTGHTNLSEFAFSGVGLNPHHGTPANAATAALDATPRVPGGSTSGGAVSVATGAAWAALGSDTGGSIRIPAALQGLVGFKSTQRLVPLDGAVPLSTTLDTACAITRSVRDAVRLHEVLASRRVLPMPREPSAWRFLVPTTLMLDTLDPAVAAAFDAALRALRDAGACIVERPLPALAELATLNATGGFAAAESWAWHRQRLATRGNQYDPRVALRIRRGEAIGAADYIHLLAARRRWIAKVEAEVQGFDALLAPTVPLLPPPIAPLLADDAAFFSVNALLLRNPSVVNFMDGCALSLPCHAAGDWPVGLMLFAPAMADDRLLAAAAFAESVLPAR
ncbi:MAG: amidase [Burkholderiaceae bacterium]|nr:amidase [Burkholderiaceae bacterium]